MEEAPLVSIITPCYNYGRFLSETLESLKAQSYTNWECIIVNDGSTDNTEEFALGYSLNDSRFRYFHQQNKGVSSARNAALTLAGGKYIQLLDADDLLEPDKLLLQVELMEKNQSIDFVYSTMLIFYINDIERTYTSFNLLNNARVSGKNEIVINALIEENFFLPGCVIFRKQLYEDVGDFNEALYGLEDWEYWCRASLLGKEFYSDDRVGTRLMCRDHQSNMSKAYIKMLNSRIEARKHIIKVTKELESLGKLQVSTTFISKILKQHQLHLLLNEYRYHLYYEKKLSAIKSIIKYSLHSGKPFFIFNKLLSSLKRTYFIALPYKF